MKHPNIKLPPIIEVRTLATAKIIFRERELCELSFNSSQYIGLKEAEEITKEVLQFYEDKYAIIVDTEKEMIHIDNKAREYFATNKEILKKRKAQALITKNIGQRLLTNFYVKFFPHPCPTKVFNNKNEAYLWISQFI